MAFLNQVQIKDANGDALLISAAGAAQVDLSGSTVPLPTGAATLAEQQTQTTALGQIETAVELLDNVVNTDGAAVGTQGILIGGTDGTNFQSVKVDANGAVSVTTDATRETSGTGSVNLTTTAETTIVAAGGAGVFNDVTNIIITNKTGAASTVTLRHGTAGTVFAEFRVPANSSVNMPLSYSYQAPAANATVTAQLAAAAAAGVRVSITTLQRT